MTYLGIVISNILKIVSYMNEYLYQSMNIYIKCDHWRGSFIYEEIVVSNLNFML